MAIDLTGPVLDPKKYWDTETTMPADYYWNTASTATTGANIQFHIEDFIHDKWHWAKPSVLHNSNLQAAPPLKELQLVTLDGHVAAYMQAPADYQFTWTPGVIPAQPCVSRERLAGSPDSLAEPWTLRSYYPQGWAGQPVPADHLEAKYRYALAKAA